MTKRQINQLVQVLAKVSKQSAAKRRQQEAIKLGVAFGRIGADLERWLRGKK